MHEYYQFLLVMKGDMFLTYGEESVHLTRGMVSILAPGVSHSVYMVSDCTQFGADLYCRDEDELSVLLQENIPTSFILQYEEGISFCEALRILARKNDRITKQMFFTKTSELLLRILSRLNDSWESRFQEQLELYLSNNLQRKVSVR